MEQEELIEKIARYKRQEPKIYTDYSEPKPDERLLTEDDIGTIAKANLKISWLPHKYLKPYLEAQDAKTASISKEEMIDWVNKTNAYWQDQLAIKDAECQARIERLFKEIEERFFTFDGDGNLIIKAVFSGRDISWWRALKKQEGMVAR